MPHVLRSPLLGELEYLLRPRPRGRFGVCRNRAQTDRELVDGAAGPGRRSPHLADVLADAVERLAPEGIDVGVAAADGTASSDAPEVDGQVTTLGTQGGPSAGHPVERAVVVEPLLRAPFELHDVEELVATVVASGLVGEVAISGLVGIVPAADHVEGRCARIEGVEVWRTCGPPRRGR